MELLLAAAMFGLLLGSASKCAVGDRAPSPSPGVPHASARADSETAPARPLDDWHVGQRVAETGGGECSYPVECVEGGFGGGVTPISPAAEPASTVTVQALTATYSATLYRIACAVCGDADWWSDEEYKARNAPLESVLVPRATALVLAWAHNQQWHHGEEVSDLT